MDTETVTRQPPHDHEPRDYPPALPAGRLKLAVVTYPNSEATGPSLARDLELVRASVLYADEIELVSLGAIMVASVAQIAADDGSNLMQLLATLDDETLRHLGGGNLSPGALREIVPLMQLAWTLDPAMRREFDEILSQLRATTDEMLAQSGANDLAPAIEAGIVKLSTAGFTPDTSDLDTTVTNWVELLKTMLRDPRVRLLFDDQVGSLVRSLVDEGHVEPHQMTLKHAGQAAVGSGLIARLPAVPAAPMDEILDLRRDLAGPLARYRAASARLAEQLTSRAFDPETPAVIDEIWTSEVAPALTEIEESFAEHKLVGEVVRSLGTDVRSLIRDGAALYIGIATFTKASEWIAGIAALAGAAAEATAKGATTRSAARRELEKRDLFYLYEVNRRL